MNNYELQKISGMDMPMSQFRKELAGKFGPKYKKWAEAKIQGLKKQFEEGKIRVDNDNAAYWSESGTYLHGDVCEVLLYVNLIGTDGYEKTVMARERQLRKGNEEMDVPRALRILDDIEAYGMKRLSGTEDITERIRIACEISLLQQKLAELGIEEDPDGVSYFNISLARMFLRTQRHVKWMCEQLSNVLVPAAV